MNRKQKLREEIKQLKANQSTDMKVDTSLTVCNALRDWIEQQAIQRIGVYFAQPDEVDLSTMIQSCLTQNKSLYAPCYQSEQNAYQFAPFECLDDLSSGKFNIPEPTQKTVSLQLIELLLVPGLAFDIYGNRLGRGGGYYDRILNQFNGISIGICSALPLQPNIPTDDWDQAVDYICVGHNIIKSGKDH